MKPQVLVLAGALAVACPVTAWEASSQVGLVEVRGSVTYSGVIPPPVDVPDAAKTRALIEVDHNHGLKGAVVWLEGVPATGGADAAKDAPVVMDQEDFSFAPHVVAIRAGGSVEFRNGDSPNHAVQASAAEPANAFNLVTPPGGRVVRRFRSAKRPIAITCPIHAGMAAWVCCGGVMR